MIPRFKKRLRQLLLDMSWYAQLVPPESIRETASATDTAVTATEAYRTTVAAVPNRIPATALVVKKVKKRKRKYTETQNYEDQGE